MLPLGWVTASSTLQSTRESVNDLDDEREQSQTRPDQTRPPEQTARTGVQLELALRSGSHSFKGSGLGLLPLGQPLLLRGLTGAAAMQRPRAATPYQARRRLRPLRRHFVWTRKAHQQPWCCGGGRFEFTSRRRCAVRMPSSSRARSAAARRSSPAEGNFSACEPLPQPSIRLRLPPLRARRRRRHTPPCQHAWAMQRGRCVHRFKLHTPCALPQLTGSVALPLPGLRWRCLDFD
jgi:hypothetical protein